MPLYDPKTGKLITWVENPEKSEVPKQLFRRIRAGESMASITRSFEEAGHLNRGRPKQKGDPVKPRPFTQQHLRLAPHLGARLYGRVTPHQRRPRPLEFADRAGALSCVRGPYRGTRAECEAGHNPYAGQRFVLPAVDRGLRGGRSAGPRQRLACAWWLRWAGA